MFHSATNRKKKATDWVATRDGLLQLDIILVLKSHTPRSHIMIFFTENSTLSDQSLFLQCEQHFLTGFLSLVLHDSRILHSDSKSHLRSRKTFFHRSKVSKSHPSAISGVKETRAMLHCTNFGIQNICRVAHLKSHQRSQMNFLGKSELERTLEIQSTFVSQSVVKNL